MPQTYREYPVRELAIVTYSKPPSIGGLGRYQAGDIVEVREPLEGIGLGECKDFLWLRIQGWDSSLLDRLKDELTNTSQADPFYVDDSTLPVTIYEKARYSVPLEAMVRIMPGFSVARATDPDDIYQPFMQMDEGNIVNLATTHLSVEVDPLIWYPLIIQDAEQLATVLAGVTEETRLTLPRTVVEAEFAEAAKDTGYFLVTHPPIDPDGLIFDKLTQRYLYA